jgi:hypothetical protein
MYLLVYCQTDLVYELGMIRNQMGKAQQDRNGRSSRVAYAISVTVMLGILRHTCGRLRVNINCQPEKERKSRLRRAGKVPRITKTGSLQILDKWTPRKAWRMSRFLVFRQHDALCIQLCNSLSLGYTFPTQTCYHQTLFSWHISGSALLQR